VVKASPALPSPSCDEYSVLSDIKVPEKFRAPQANNPPPPVDKQHIGKGGRGGCGGGGGDDDDDDDDDDDVDE